MSNIRNRDKSNDLYQINLKTIFNGSRSHGPNPVMGEIYFCHIMTIGLVVDQKLDEQSRSYFTMIPCKI